MNRPGKFKLGLTISILIILTACMGCVANNLGVPSANAELNSVALDEISNTTVPAVNFQESATPIITTDASATKIIAPTSTPEATNTPKPAATPQPTATAAPVPTATPVQVSSPTPIAFKGKGTVIDRKFYSPILKRQMPYRIYLPAGYQTSQQRYPVLYMLHGLSGSYLEWIDYKLLDTADSMMSQGTIKQMIIVLPSGDQEYWVDHANNGPQYGTYVVQDVVGHIDATYRTLANRENRAIGGHSMGGHGALQLAFNHPDVFSVAGAHSPTLRTKAEAQPFFGDDAFYAVHDPVSLARTAANLGSLKIWLDIGTLDKGWRPRVEELDQNLTQRGIAHEWHLFEGDHAGDYWTQHVPDYMKFYSNGLAGK